MIEATTYPCHHETARCPALREHLWHSVSPELEQCIHCGSVFDAAPRCPNCGTAHLRHSVSPDLVPFDPEIVEAARRMPQIVHELESSVVILDRVAQCIHCGSVFLAASRCPYCGTEKPSLDEDLPVGSFYEDYDDDGNLRDDVRRKGRPRCRPVSDGEMRKQLESEFEDSGRPNLYEDVQNYLFRRDDLRQAERSCRDRARSIAPVRRCRARARRSHRIVRVVKTAGGDSGDGDPEPPEPRALPHRGGGAITVCAAAVALVALLVELIGGGQ